MPRSAADSPTRTGLDIYLSLLGVEPTVEPSAATTRSLAAWPNPSSGAVKVRLNAPESWKGTIRVEVSDVLGRSMTVLAERPAYGVLDLIWSSEVAQGTYIIHAYCGNERLSATIERK